MNLLLCCMFICRCRRWRVCGRNTISVTVWRTKNQLITCWRVSSWYSTTITSWWNWTDCPVKMRLILFPSLIHTLMVKGVYSSLEKPVSELYHQPHGITQCYLPSDTSERAPYSRQPGRPELSLLTPQGWKAELTWGLIRIKIHRVRHPSE